MEFINQLITRGHHLAETHHLFLMATVMAMAISYSWLFLLDYRFYKWGFVSTYNCSGDLPSTVGI